MDEKRENLKDIYLIREDIYLSNNIFSGMEKGMKKVLKIDVESSEYIIFEDLYKNKLIQEFDVIIGEYHNGIGRLFPFLSNFYRPYKEKTYHK